MKTTKKHIITGGTLLVSGFGLVLSLFSSGALAAIAGSAHDFSDGAGFNADAWNTSGEICVVCHTPHNSDVTVTEAALWDHELTAVAAYTPYSNPGSLDSAPSAAITGLSKLCLSCHDGTVALDSYGGVTGSTVLTGSRLVGTDLGNDHPVAFTYNATLATTDGALANPTTATVTNPDGITGTPTISTALLFGAGNDQVECVSCHNVHNKGGFDNLLRVDNAGSALCLTCHTK